MLQHKLLLATIKLHKLVTTAAIANWLKAIMKLAVIDTGKYKAHSTRRASTSKAFAQGMLVNKSFEAADWSNAGTCYKF